MLKFMVGSFYTLIAINNLRLFIAVTKYFL